MKSLGKTLRDSRRRTHSRIAGWLRPRIGAIGTNLRLAARIRIANRWASRHPKKTFGYVAGSLLMVLVCDVMVAGLRAEMNEPDVSMIANVEPVFNGFRTIQSNKERQRRTILEMTATGQSLRHEIDSLIAIPSKTHADSVGIISRYSRLESIVKSLKTADND